MVLSHNQMAYAAIVVTMIFGSLFVGVSGIMDTTIRYEDAGGDVIDDEDVTQTIKDSDGDGLGRTKRGYPPRGYPPRTPPPRRRRAAGAPRRRGPPNDCTAAAISARCGAGGAQAAWRTQRNSRPQLFPGAACRGAPRRRCAARDMPAGGYCGGGVSGFAQAAGGRRSTCAISILCWP